MNLHLLAYLIYLPIVIGLTTFVAKTLFKNSLVFMMDIFNQRESIAKATNRLFEIGFYLINIGFAFNILEMSSYDVASYRAIVETLSSKIGGFSIYLGIMMFLNLFLFFRGKRKAKQHQILKG